MTQVEGTSRAKAWKSENTGDIIREGDVLMFRKMQKEGQSGEPNHSNPRFGSPVTNSSIY